MYRPRHRPPSPPPAAGKLYGASSAGATRGSGSQRWETPGGTRRTICGPMPPARASWRLISRSVVAGGKSTSIIRHEFAPSSPSACSAVPSPLEAGARWAWSAAAAGRQDSRANRVSRRWSARRAMRELYPRHGGCGRVGMPDRAISQPPLEIPIGIYRTTGVARVAVELGQRRVICFCRNERSTACAHGLFCRRLRARVFAGAGAVASRKTAAEVFGVDSQHAYAGELSHVADRRVGGLPAGQAAR